MSQNRTSEKPPLSLENLGVRLAASRPPTRRRKQLELTAKKAADLLRENLDGKNWKPVVGFDDFYIVTDEGNVISLRQGIVMSGRYSTSGYLSLTLCGHPGKKMQSTGIHRIVAEAFHGSPPSRKHEVNHRNGIKTDNRAENLEWVSRSENQIHAVKIGLKPCGENTHMSKLTEKQAIEVLSLKGKMSQQKIGELYGIQQTQVGRIHRGLRWKKLHQPTT